MNVAVLGAGGHLGAALCHALCSSAPNKVTAIVQTNRPRPNLAGLDLDIVCADLDDADFETLLAGFDTVYDVAAPYPMRLGTPSQQLQRWFTRYIRLLATITTRSMQYRFVSSFVTLPRKQSATASLVNRSISKTHPYYVTKQRIETMVMRAQQGNPNIHIYCPSACIGPWNEKPAEQNLVLQIAQGNFPIVPRHQVNVVDVRDVARVMVADREPGAGRIPVFGHTLTISSFVTAVVGAGGQPTTIDTPTAAPKIAALAADALGTIFDRPNEFGLLGLLALENYAVHPTPVSCATIGLAQSISESLSALR